MISLQVLPIDPALFTDLKERHKCDHLLATTSVIFIVIGTESKKDLTMWMNNPGLKSKKPKKDDPANALSPRQETPPEGMFYSPTPTLTLILEDGE